MSVPAIQGVPTSTTAFLGLAASGPLNSASHVQGFAQYAAQFGQMAAHLEMSSAAYQFFANGGTDLYVVRMRSIDRASVQAGLQSLKGAPTLGLLALPGVSDPAILAEAANYCQQRRIFLLVDAPRNATTVALLSQFVSSDARLPNAASAAVFAPWIQGSNVGEAAPSGTIAGLFARTDQNAGVWKAPAGINAALLGVTKLSADFNEAEIAALHGAGVNPLRNLPQHGFVLWGANTLDSQDANWKYIPVRRLALYLEQSISQGLQWTVFEPNGPALWAQVRTSVGNFLQGLFHQGALRGPTAQQAYFVKCDASTTTQADIENGIVNIVVGFAVLKPAEFVVIQISQLVGSAANPPHRHL